MKLLIVNYEYPPLGGGGGIAARDIAVELAKRHEVHVLTSGAPGLAAEEVVDRVRIVRAPVWGRDARATASLWSMVSFWPVGLRYGRRQLAGERYDAIHTWFAVPSGPTGAHLARGWSVPHILTMAGGDIYDPSKWYTPDKNPVLRRVVRWVLADADRLVACSTDLARRARDIYGVERPIEVVPHGVDAPLVEPTTRAALGLASDRLYLIAVGRLVRRKNLATLLRAMAALKRPDLSLLIVGDGPEQGPLAALAGTLGVAPQVEFLGFVPQAKKQQLLEHADIFALPSLHEAFGLVYLEAMHAGLPVIASKPGGQEDFLVEGQSGYLVAPGDRSALERALADLVDDADLRRRMGAFNRDHAKRYSAATAAARYERLLAGLAQRDVATRARAAA